MCELFAMSSREPTNVRLSLGELARHGGGTAPHADGWGIASFRGRDVSIIKDTAPAAVTPWIPFIREHGLASRIVITHLRKATQGEVTFANTQPFARELGGRMHVFAHNGDLSGVRSDPRLLLGRFMPIGETDSEHAFMALLNLLEPLWLDGTGPPDLLALTETIVRYGADLRGLGPANFLYSDGNFLFAHADRRRQANGTIAAPGLWYLRRTCSTEPLQSDGPVALVHPTPQEVVLVASVPLTTEAWSPMETGSLLAIRDGQILDL